MLGVHQAFDNPLTGIPRYTSYLCADTFQVFTRNNRTCKQRKISMSEIDAFNSTLLQLGITSWVIHAPYVMNPCRMDRANIDMVINDMKMLYSFAGNKYYVLHPGSSVGYGEAIGLQRMFNFVECVMPYVGNTKLAIEVMAGQGTQIMSRNWHIQSFCEHFKDFNNVGICLDTCHAFGAGMDFIGLYNLYREKIFVIHLNNSRGSLGSRIDRHSYLESGCIPTNLLLQLFDSARFNSPDVPIILETPSNYLEYDLRFLQQYMRLDSQI